LFEGKAMMSEDSLRRRSVIAPKHDFRSRLVPQQGNGEVGTARDVA